MFLFISFLIVVNIFIILLFLQFIGYGIFSYFRYWRKKYKLNISLDKVESLAKKLGKEIPEITIIIPARSESFVISSTIRTFMSMNYPKDKYNLLIVLDEKELSEKLYEETTIYHANKEKEYYNSLFKREIISLTSVPPNFDGKFPGELAPSVVNSNKPRALNWSLLIIPRTSQIIGFYDADSQPDVDTLLYVAQKYITKGNNPLLLQGPVVQVRNYFNLRIFNKIYALTQAITHEWFLPVLLEHLPFIGGTNFFIEPKLLYKVKGFDHTVLSEDLELGCRLYIESDVWPEFLPYISTEQTPPNYKSFFIQRLRWASGYMQVIKDMLTEEGNIYKRFVIFSMLIFYGILPWIATQILSIATVGLFIMSFFGATHFFNFFPEDLKILSIGINICYFGILMFYFRYAIKKYYIPVKSSYTGLIGFNQFIGLLVLPIASVLGSLPYLYGFVISLFGYIPPLWVKTARSKEIS